MVNAAQVSKQDVSLLRTAVKATRWQKEVVLDDVGTEVEVKGELENSFEPLRMK